MKKILHVINSLGTGGAEKLVSELVPLQIKDGNNVEILILSETKSIFKEELWNNGINIIELNKNIKYIYNPINIFKIKKIIKNYDIVHVHLFPAQYWVAIAASMLNFKGVLITTEHSTENNRRGKFIFRIIDRWIYKRYDKTVAISDKVKDNLISHIKDCKNICIIENGVNLESIINSRPIDLKDQLDLPKNTFLIGQIARFSFPKDQDSVIRALKLLPTNVHAVFVGDGERRKECEELAKKEGVYDRTHFLGIRNDISEILKSLDIAVLSSKFEGFGLSAIEAIASGTPTLASNVPGLKEIIENCGVMFDYQDVYGLKNEIIKLMNNKSYYDSMARKCKSESKKFDIKIMKERYYNIYFKSHLK